MSNKAYNRSIKRERELVNQFRAMGMDSGRTAGSKSPHDVYAITKNRKTVYLIQVKTKKNGRKVRVTEDKTIEGAIVVIRTMLWE